MLTLVSSGAEAQLGQDGSAIEGSDYTLDLYSGVVQGSARMVGLGGAFVAIAEGVDGNLVNAATPALRPNYSVDHFDYWLGFALTAPFSVGDFYNTGGFSRGAGYGADGYTYLAPSANLQWGPLGVGVTFEAQTAHVTASGTAARPEDEANIRFQFMKVRVQGAYQFLDGQLILGVGGLLVVQRAAGGDNVFVENELYVTSGFTAEAGALFRPNNEQYRLAASLEGAVTTGGGAGDEGDVIEEDFFLPRSVEKPWEARFGFAYQFGSRPLNPVWQNVDEVILREMGDLWESMSADEKAIYTKETWRRLRREYRALDRHYLLLSTALHVIGPTQNAVSVEGFLTQLVQRSGANISLSPRWGIETDVVPGWLKLRYGNYIEPSRVAQTNYRFHWTFGLDVKAGWWDVFGIWSEDYLWTIGLSADIAHDYSVWSLGFGGWY